MWGQPCGDGVDRADVDSDRAAFVEPSRVEPGAGSAPRPGYSLHVTAPLHLHQALLAAAETVGQSASAADRKAYRIYRERLDQRHPS